MKKQCSRPLGPARRDSPPERGFIPGMGMLFLVCFLVLTLGTSLFGASSTDYSALKKFLSARMYVEAYDEMMRNELMSEREDPKLTKLKKELQENARKDAQSRARVHPDDPTVLTILADLDYQDNQIDSGVEKISQAIQKSPTVSSYYVFSKLMFAKGDYQQSYDAMEKAFQADPNSEAIMADFQFLYNCKSYGLATGKKISQNTDFLRRSFQVAANKPAAQGPDNPFENDPTQPPQVNQPPEPDPPEPDPLTIAKLPDDPKKDPKKGPKTPPASQSMDPVGSEPAEIDLDGASLTMDPPDEVKPPTIITEASASVKPVDPDEDSEQDPEKKKMRAAENLLKEAAGKLEEKKFEDARVLLRKAQATFPGIPGVEEMEEKIRKSVDTNERVEQDYLTAVKLFENESYDLAKKGILKAYEDNPDKHPEAKFYLGKIYVFGTERDLKKARFYFDLCLKDPKVDADLKRDIDWIVIGILADNEEYEEAYQRFTDFESREPDYAKSRGTYSQLKYLLWYKNYATQVHIGLGVFFGSFLLVFFLRLMPAFSFFMRDPLKRAKASWEKKQIDAAVKIAEEALRRGKQPIQIQRELIEMCIEGHYQLKNYFKCQEHAKHLLKLFAENPKAWKYLALTFLETKATNDEAIAMYEESYKREPDNKAYLPFLAKHYIAQKQFTVESLNILYDYFRVDKQNRENVLALAETYVQTKRMGDEVVAVLEEALKDKPDNNAFRELLARNFAKIGKFSEATRECLRVLSSEINNMGIHVVYTSCMKKLNMLEEAVLQYEEFSKKFRGNPQIAEILTGLRKELEQSGGGSQTEKSIEELSPFSEELITEEPKTSSLPDSEVDIDSFVEPPLEGFDPHATDIPLPDFMKELPAENTPEKPVKSPVVPEKAKKSAMTTDLVDEFLSEPIAPAGTDGIDPFMDGPEDVLMEPLKPQPKPLPISPIKEKKPEKKVRNALEDFIDDQNELPDDLLGGSDDDLTKGLLDDSDVLQQLGKDGGNAKAFTGSGDLPDDLSPESDLGDLTTLDPFTEEGAGGLDSELASLISGKEPAASKKTAKPVSGKKTEKGVNSRSDDVFDELTTLLPPKKTKTPEASSKGKIAKTPEKTVSPFEEPSSTKISMPVPAAKLSDDSPFANVIKDAATGEAGVMGEARRKISQKKWDEAIKLLTPVFATSRDRMVGHMLADSYLHQKKPELAKEILDTLELDPEMMDETMKDIIYRVGLALEESGNPAGALALYDIICNVDINFRDAFDRSDRLYGSKKKG